MSGSYRLHKKQIRDSRKLFQPPQLMSSGLLSSHDKSQFQQERINELSNVQEKSYNSSEASGHDQAEFQEFIANMKATDPFEQPPSPIRRKMPSNIRRIQDHDIIVVQEQNEICSNSGDKESVILEHIDFNSDEKQPEETPEWQNPQNNYKHDGVNYVINCVEVPHFLVQENENASSSSPNDFSTSQVKNQRVRYSKNTCIQRTDSRDSNHVKNFTATNKSCIAQPVNRKNSKESSSPQSSNQLDINQILSKWNNYIYPELENEYLRKDSQEDARDARRNTISYNNIQKQAKYCISSYQNPNSRIQGIDDFSQLKSTNKGKQDKQVQTLETRINSSVNISQEKIRNLQEKTIKYEQQIIRMLTKQKQLQKELAYLRENLTLKSEQIQNLRSTLEHTNQSRNRLNIDESKRMESKNKELEKIINDQNLTIRIFQQKQDDLQKKLHETVSFLQKSVQMKSFQSKSMQFDRLNAFQPVQSNRFQGNIHEVCNAKIQSLQQYIFDIEQKRVGIDLQVEKRLEKAKEELEQQLKRNINEQYKIILNNLKQQNSKLREMNALTSSERNQNFVVRRGKQIEFNEREEMVKKIYDQPVTQRNQADKTKGRSIQNRSNFIKSKVPTLITSRLPKTYDPLNANNSTQQDTKHDSPLKNNHYSNKSLFSPTKQKSNFSGLLSYEAQSSSIKYFDSILPNLRSNASENSISGYERMTFGKDNKYRKKEFVQNYETRENNDLYVINSKIQRLRSQINRELDLIH